MLAWDHFKFKFTQLYFDRKLESWRYVLIWVCSSPDFAGRYPLRQRPGSKMDSKTPQQFRETNTLVTDRKVGSEVALDPPIHAFNFSPPKTHFRSVIRVILPRLGPPRTAAASAAKTVSGSSTHSCCHLIPDTNIRTDTNTIWNMPMTWGKA